MNHPSNKFPIGNEQGVITSFKEPFIRIPSSYISAYFYEFESLLFKTSSMDTRSPADPLLKELACFFGYSSIGSIFSTNYQAYQPKASTDSDKMESWLHHFITHINQFGWGKWALCEPFRMMKPRFILEHPFDVEAYMHNDEEPEYIKSYFSTGIAWALVFFAQMDQPIELSYEHFRAIYHDRQQDWDITTSIEKKDIDKKGREKKENKWIIQIEVNRE